MINYAFLKYYYSLSMFTTDKNANIKNEFKYIANYVSKI